MHSEAITQLVYRMIENHMLPIGVEEGAGVRELVRYLESKYVMPLRATMSKRIEKMLEEYEDELKVKLARDDRLALTTGQISQTKATPHLPVTSSVLTGSRFSIVL